MPIKQQLASFPIIAPGVPHSPVSLALCSLLGSYGEGDHSKNSNIHSSYKQPAQRLCQLEEEAPWSWDRRGGFVSKSVVSRERKILVTIRVGQSFSCHQTGASSVVSPGLREPIQI